MEICAGIETGECAFHGGAHAHLVDETHVEYLEPLLVDEALLAGIDAANPDLADTRRRNSRHVPADPHEFVWPEAAQASHRHPMQIAAWREDAGIEVCVRIEPEHAKGEALVSTVAS